MVAEIKIMENNPIQEALSGLSINWVSATESLPPKNQKVLAKCCKCWSAEEGEIVNALYQGTLHSNNHPYPIFMRESSKGLYNYSVVVKEWAFRNEDKQ